MKFVHIADVHLDRPFVNLSDKDNLGDLKRIEQRRVFKKVIEYIKNNNIDCLFIAGDLYEHQYVKQSTIEYINNLFKEIGKTKVFIAPGNHDPFIKNSYYNKYDWNDNVHIFDGNISKVEFDDTNIYGFGFNDFYCSDSGIEDFEIGDYESSDESSDENSVEKLGVNKNNVLIIHGTLDGANLEDKQYNSMSTRMLESKGFDYVALGHVHLDNFDSNANIVYPGSLTALGFDEVGNHGMVVGELKDKKLSIEYIPIESTKFVKRDIDVSLLYSKEDLIQKIDEMFIDDNELVEIVLVGNRNFEIDINSIYSLVFNNNIIKIKDKTKMSYDLEKLSRDTTLKGLFVKAMKEKLDDDNITEEERVIVEKAIEIGLDALN